MASKRRILALSIFGTAIIVFYLFMSSLCFGGFCISEGRPFVSGYHRAPVFYNGRKCEPDQTSIQNRHPRKSWSLREYSCEQLPKNLPTGVECITEAELGKYFWDISNPKPPPPTLPMYRSHCWCISRPSPTTKSVVCIPPVYVIGVEKCGTVGLIKGIRRHPLVEKANSMEQRPFTGENPLGYSHLFSAALWNITHHCTYSASTEYHPRFVVGDNPTTLFNPLTLQSLRHLVPNARIIVTLRNPIDKLYSEYIHLVRSKGYGPEDFHNRIISQLSLLQTCLNTSSTESCAYQSKGRPSVHRGLYAIFLEKLFTIYPRDQIYVSNLHFWIKDRVGSLERVFGFLGLELPPADVYKDLRKKYINNRTHYPGRNNKLPMWNKTRRLLEDFFRPYNHRLACLLGDERYLW